MKHLILALLAATFSLSVTAASTYGKIEIDNKDGRTINTTKSNTFREACKSAKIDGMTIKQRQAAEQEQQKCEKEASDAAAKDASRKIKDAVVK